MAVVRVAVSIGRYPRERYSVHRGYEDALWQLGALPQLLVPPPSEAPDELSDAAVAVAATADALVLTGGGDIDPAFQAVAPAGVADASLMDLEPERDAYELAVVAAFRAAGRPVLGICRGIQVLAVASGGSLIADLPAAGVAGHWEEERQYEPVHTVETESGSVAAGLFPGERTVNSIHHQAVAGGGALTPTAWAPDGTIEALEGDGVLGVQWHPERLIASDATHLGPFRWLLGAAGR